ECGRRQQPEAPGEAAVDAQQEMPCLAVEAVEIGIGRGLLDDEDRLAKAQQLVEPVGREFGEALPFERDFWHAGQDTRLRRSRCRSRIMARFPMYRAASGGSSPGPRAPGSRSGSSPISNFFR